MRIYILDPVEYLSPLEYHESRKNKFNKTINLLYHIMLLDDYHRIIIYLMSKFTMNLLYHINYLTLVLFFVTKFSTSQRS